MSKRTIANLCLCLSTLMLWSPGLRAESEHCNVAPWTGRIKLTGDLLPEHKANPNLTHYNVRVCKTTRTGRISKFGCSPIEAPPDEVEEKLKVLGAEEEGGAPSNAAANLKPPSEKEEEAPTHYSRVPVNKHVCVIPSDEHIYQVFYNRTYHDVNVDKDAYVDMKLLKIHSPALPDKDQYQIFYYLDERSMREQLATLFYTSVDNRNVFLRLYDKYCLDKQRVPIEAAEQSNLCLGLKAENFQRFMTFIFAFDAHHPLGRDIVPGSSNYRMVYALRTIHDKKVVKVARRDPEGKVSTERIEQPFNRYTDLATPAKRYYLSAGPSRAAYTLVLPGAYGIEILDAEGEIRSESEKRYQSLYVRYETRPDAK